MLSVKQVLIVEDLPDVADWLHQQVVSILDPDQVSRATNLADAVRCMEQQRG